MHEKGVFRAAERTVAPLADTREWLAAPARPRAGRPLAQGLQLESTGLLLGRRPIAPRWR